MESNLNKLIADKAKYWADSGVPYRHRGISFTGCDCTGLLIGILKTLGYKANGWALRNYPLDWNIHAGAGNYIVEELSPYTTSVNLVNAIPGDLLLFKFGKCIAHMGILIDTSSKLFVHSHITAGKCKYGILGSSPWGKRLIGVRRLDDTKMAQFL